jgi:hypothetical protein
MGLAEYMIVAQGDEWRVLHDGSINNLYATKESAFEAAVAAASLAFERDMKSTSACPIDRPETRPRSARKISPDRLWPWPATPAGRKSQELR